jgi:hypothetical protein
MNVPVQGPFVKTTPETHVYESEEAPKDVQEDGNDGQEIPFEFQPADDLKDNIPTMKSAPTSEEAMGFFKEKGLL